MDMLLHIESECFAELEKLAKASGRTVEDVASEIVKERVAVASISVKENGPFTQRTQRRSYHGIPWETIPIQEQARIHREGYEKFPLHSDEFAIHPDDEAAFSQAS